MKEALALALTLGSSLSSVFIVSKSDDSTIRFVQICLKLLNNAPTIMTMKPSHACMALPSCVETHRINLTMCYITITGRLISHTQNKEVDVVTVTGLRVFNTSTKL